MILLDAFALVAYLRDEVAADEVTSILRQGSCVISAVNLAEALDQLLRVDELRPPEVAQALSGLIGGTIEIRAVDEPIAWRAAEIRARRYQRRGSDLSLADCVLLASAGRDDVVATSDRAVMKAADAEGIKVRALPM